MTGKAVTVIPQLTKAKAREGRRLDVVESYITALEQCQTPAEVEALKAQAERDGVKHIFHGSTPLNFLWKRQK
jgi:hypothetical protein